MSSKASTENKVLQQYFSDPHLSEYELVFEVFGSVICLQECSHRNSLDHKTN